MTAVHLHATDDSLQASFSKTLGMVVLSELGDKVTSHTWVCSTRGGGGGADGRNGQSDLVRRWCPLHLSVGPGKALTLLTVCCLSDVLHGRTLSNEIRPVEGEAPPPPPLPFPHTHSHSFVTSESTQTHRGIRTQEMRDYESEAWQHTDQGTGASPEYTHCLSLPELEPTFCTMARARVKADGVSHTISACSQCHTSCACFRLLPWLSGRCLRVPGVHWLP